MKKLLSLAVMLVACASIATAQSYKPLYATYLEFKNGSKLTINPPAFGADHSWTLPSSNGAGVLTNDGSGGLTWTAVSGTGTVTSVNASTTLSGLSFSGGPITASGTLSLTGTLGSNSGGTGKTNANMSGQTGKALVVNATEDGYDFATVGGGGSGTVTSVSANSPLSITGTATINPTVNIADADADGSTKGAASFTANDFDASSGNISIDYANGQSASGSTKGFLTSADWTTFNNKQSALTLGDLTSSDITVTGGTGAVVGGGTSLTIMNSAVTFAKMQDVADGSLIGNTSGGSGPMHVITVSSPLTLSSGVLSLQSSSVWLTGGNASTPGDGSVYVGTSDAQPLYLKVNNGTDNRMILFVNSAISLGKNATASQPDALAIGTGSNAGGTGGSISIGPSSISTGASSVAIGNGANSSSTGGIAIGGGSTSGSNSVAIGPGASAAGTSSKAEGHNASAAGNNSVALGSNSSVVSTAPSSISIGPSAVTMVNSSSTVVIGASAQAQANSNNGVALGSSAVIMSPSSISIGPSAVVQTLSSSSISIGNGASTTGVGSTNVGGGGNVITSDYSAIMGGRGLTLDGDRSFGFHSNNSGGTAPMTITSNDVVVFGNSSIWLANNNSTPSSLVFYEAESGTGAFPSSTKSVSFVSPSVLTATQAYTLPLDYPSSSGMVLSSTTGGVLSWVAAGGGLSGGTNNVVTKWTGATSVGTSTITDDGTDVSTTSNLKLTGSNKQLSFKGNSTGVTTFAAGTQGATNINYTLPTTLPIVNQTLTATAVSSSDVTLGWSSHGAIVFNSSTTWVVPPGVTVIHIQAAGGGGGGGGGGGDNSGNTLDNGEGGGGGGGGALCNRTFTVTAGETLTITIGTGGTAGTAGANSGGNGGNGGTGGTTTVSGSSSGSLVSATGGSGGTGGEGDNGGGNSNGQGGAGAVGSASNMAGATGTAGQDDDAGGAGGAGGYYGGGAGGQGGIDLGTDDAGDAGSAGLAGFVVITW